MANTPLEPDGTQIRPHPGGPVGAALKLPFAWLGAGGGGFLRGLAGSSPAELRQFVQAREAWLSGTLGQLGVQPDQRRAFMESLYSAADRAGRHPLMNLSGAAAAWRAGRPAGLRAALGQSARGLYEGTLIEQAVAGAVESAAPYFETRSLSGWLAGGITLAGRPVGTAAMGAVGQIAGSAVGGVLRGIVGIGGLAAASTIRALPVWGISLAKLAGRSTEAITRYAAAHGGPEAIAADIGDSLLTLGKRTAAHFFEPLPEGAAPTNMIEGILGYRLRAGPRRLIGGAFLLAPLVGVAVGALEGQIAVARQPLVQSQRHAGVVGSTYGARQPRRPIDDLGADGDLVLALHALRN